MFYFVNHFHLFMPISLILFYPLFSPINSWLFHSILNRPTYHFNNFLRYKCLTTDTPDWLPRLMGPVLIGFDLYFSCGKLNYREHIIQFCCLYCVCLPANIFVCLRQRSQVQSNHSQIWIVGNAYDSEDDRRRSIKPEVVAAVSYTHLTLPTNREV